VGDADYDLPEPRPRGTLSETEFLEHRWKLWRTLFVFAVLYGTLHKVFIPLFLTLTTVLVRDYTQVDFWALPGLMLGAHLLRRSRLGRWGSLLAGVLVGYAAWETRSIAIGAHHGWLAWSHALSSLPQGLMAIVLLSLAGRGRDLRFAWGGALFAICFLMLGDFLAPTPQAVPSSTHASGELLPKLDSLACGAQAFRVERHEVARVSQLRLKGCGFSPPYLRVDSKKKLMLVRDEATAMNLRIVFYNRNGQRHRQSNRILRLTDSNVELSELSFSDGEIAAVLFSDAQPSFGKVLVLPEASEDDPAFYGVGADRRLLLGDPR